MNDIIINQYKNSEIWGISIDALLSAFIAIIVFILGFLFNKKYEDSKDKKRLKGIEMFFWTIIDSMVEPIKFQLKQYQEIANKINDKFVKDFTYFENPELNFQTYKNINPVDLHKIFFSKKKLALSDKAKHFTVIVKTLEFIDSQKNSLKQNINQFFIDFRTYESDWKMNIEEFFNRYETFVGFNRRQNIPASQDDFLKQVDRTVNNCSKVEKYPNAFIIYENLVKPILELCKQFPKDIRANEINPYLIEAEYAFSNLTNLRKIYHNLFLQEATNLEKEYKAFTISINVLKNA